MMARPLEQSDQSVGPRYQPGARRAATEANAYDDGCLRVEHDNYYAVCKGSRISLSRTEFLLLSRLTLDAERVVGFEELWRHARGGRTPFNADSLRVHLYRMRKTLGPFGIRVESQVGVGYRISLAGCCLKHGQVDRPGQPA